MTENFNKEQIKRIIQETVNHKWLQMQTKDDLLALLNMVSKLLFGEKVKVFEIKHLDNAASDNTSRYISFQIPKKKRGEFRNIDAPKSKLKRIQRCLNYIFQQIYTPTESAIGFIPDRSIVDGAKLHLSQKYVYNIDLKDFFPSISSGRLYMRLQSKPFELTPQMASFVTNLCCYKNSEDKYVLPQGAPTSPIITNFICERLDYKLCKLATAYGLKYTRYADDITFSGMKNVFSEDGRFCKSLRNIIENEEHFTINTEKTRLCHIGMRQEVTGLTVNKKVNVSRKYIKQLRAMINNLEKKGYEEAQCIFQKNYIPTKHANATHHIENVIRGKLDFLKMIKGYNDTTYLKLKERFESILPNLEITKEEDCEL